MDLNVATPVTVNGLEYNEQETQPSRLQKRKLGAYLYPQQSQAITITDGQYNSTVVQFMVGSQYFLDTKSSYILLNAQLQNTSNVPANNHAYLNPYTESWIQELTILSAGGVQIEKITNANALGSIMGRVTELQYSSSIGKEALNMFDPLTDEQGVMEARSVRNYRYVIELRLSKFLHSCYNYLPLRAMSMGNSNAFQIQIVFGSFNNLVTAYNGADGPNAPTNTAYNSNGNPPLKVVLSNIVYNQALVEDSIKEEQISNILKENPIVISYETHRHFQNTIKAGASTQATINITEYQESVLDVHSVFRLVDNVDQTKGDSTLFVNPDIIAEQVQIQPDYYPLQQISCPVIVPGVPNVSELFYQYILTNNKQKCYIKGVKPSRHFSVGLDSVSSCDTTDFILATNFRVFPDDAVGPSDYIQYSAGLNLKKNPNPIAINLTLNSSPPVPIYVDTYTTYMSSLVLQSNSLFVIS